MSNTSVVFLDEHLARFMWSLIKEGDNSYILTVNNELISGNNDGSQPIGIWGLKNRTGDIQEQKLFIR